MRAVTSNIEIYKLNIKKEPLAAEKLKVIRRTLEKASIHLDIFDTGDYYETTFSWSRLEVDMKCSRFAGRNRKIQDMDWNKYDELKKQKLSDTAISKYFDISRRTLCRLKKERAEKESP